MVVTRGLLGAVIFAAIALGSASPAAAGDPIAGVYTYAQPGELQSQWQIWPTCVPAGCVLHIGSTTPGYGPLGKYPGFSGDARLVNDRWTMGVNIPDGMTCADGSTALTSTVYSFDEKALTGTRTNFHGAVCGLQPARSTQSFTLAYVQPLPIPVELYPLQCPTWPNCDVNTVIPGQINSPPPPPPE